MGVGIHPWGKFPDKTFVDLGVVAIENALKDAGLAWKDVQSMTAGCWAWGGTDGMNTGPRIAATLGETGIPITNIYNMCATGTSVFREGYFQVASGMYDVVLALGLDVSPPGFFSVIGKDDPKRFQVVGPDWLRWKMVGLTNPGCWALECRKRMETFGTTEVHLAKAKVAASKHGALNPNALYRKVFTVEEILASPMVCDPLRLFMICATRDGAGAAILCSMEKARQLTAKPVQVAGIGLGSSLYGDPTIRLGLVYAPVKAEAPRVSESASSSRQAYKMAGIGPEDVDFVELPDNSSWHYLQYIETLGFCPPGGADRLLDEGQTGIGGKVPVCPSGGVASFGEAATAQGLAQIFELVTQLRGQAGARQVKGAKVGLAQTYGQLGNSACAIFKV